MVHFNAKYGTYDNAVNYPDGRVVVAIFLQVYFENVQNVHMHDLSEKWLIRQVKTQMSLGSSPLNLWIIVSYFALTL